MGNKYSIACKKYLGVFLLGSEPRCTLQSLPLGIGKGFSLPIAHAGILQIKKTVELSESYCSMNLIKRLNAQFKQLF
jgi:hypothetical protein